MVIDANKVKQQQPNHKNSCQVKWQCRFKEKWAWIQISKDEWNDGYLAKSESYDVEPNLLVSILQTVIVLLNDPFYSLKRYD